MHRGRLVYSMWGVTGGVALISSYFLPWTYVPGLIRASSSPRSFDYGWIVLVLGIGLLLQGVAMGLFEDRNPIVVNLEKGMRVVPFLCVSFIVWRAAAVWFGVDTRPAVWIFDRGLAVPRSAYGYWIAVGGSIAGVFSVIVDRRHAWRISAAVLGLVILVSGVTYACSRPW